MPAQLREMMRHASTQTTMDYYVGQNAERTAAIMDEVDRQSSKDTCSHLPVSSDSPEINLG